MTEDERAARLMELEKKISELINIISSSREEAPEAEMKEIRCPLQVIKRKIRDAPGTLTRAELVATLRDTVEALNKAMNNSGSKRLTQAHKLALSLLIKYY